MQLFLSKNRSIVMFVWTELLALQANDMGTNAAMRYSTLMAQDETAVKHKPKCVPAGSWDQTLDSSYVSTAC